MANDGKARDGHGRYLRTPESAQRDAQAAHLRGQSYSYQRIADELGFSHRTDARDAVVRAMSDIVRESGEEARAMEHERLDRLSEAAWQVLENQHVTVSYGKIVSIPDPVTGEEKPLADDGPVLQAIDRLLRISESRRKLDGLDAPARLSVDAQTIGQEISGILDQLVNPPDDRAR